MSFRVPLWLRKSSSEHTSEAYSSADIYESKRLNENKKQPPEAPGSADGGVHREALDRGMEKGRVRGYRGVSGREPIRFFKREFCEACFGGLR